MSKSSQKASKDQIWFPVLKTLEKLLLPTIETATNQPQIEADSSKHAMNENELPANLKGLWDKAVKALRMQNFDYVVDLLLPIVKEAPAFLDARRALRKAQMQAAGGKKKGFLASAGGMKSAMKIKPKIATDPLGAINDLEDELKSDPGSKALNDLLYDAAMAAELPEVALLALDTLKGANPKDVPTLMRIAKHHMDTQKYTAASEAYNQVSALDASNMDAIKGAMQASTKASMEKNKLEEGGTKRNDEAAKRDELLGRDISSLTPEQVDQQLEIFLADYAENNENVVVVKRLARLYEKKNDIDSAISYYDWAKHLSKGDPALEKKINDLQDKQRDVEFIAMEKALAENPDAPDAAEKRARLEELRQARLVQKVAYAREQVEKNPTDHQLRFLLADYLFQSGQATDAIPELQRAKNNPNVRIKALLLLGRCFASKGMDDLAISQLQEAEKELNVMDGTKKDIVYERALIHERRDEKTEYIDALKLIYEVDYEFRDVAKRVESSYS